jgi:hypothetical protein
LIKWISISFFIGLILFKPIAQLSWEVWYATNIEYVAEELCENKEEPEMKCNGKCYLAKQLAKVEVEQQEDPSPEKPVNPFQAKQEPPVIHQGHLLFDLASTPIESKKSQFIYLCTPYTAIFGEVFHPPRRLS